LQRPARGSQILAMARLSPSSKAGTAPLAPLARCSAPGLAARVHLATHDCRESLRAVPRRLAQELHCVVDNHEMKVFRPYFCSACGHAYNFDLDDRGLAFDELPAFWSCPVCSATSWQRSPCSQCACPTCTKRYGSDVLADGYDSDSEDVEFDLELPESTASLSTRFTPTSSPAASERGSSCGSSLAGGCAEAEAERRRITFLPQDATKLVEVQSCYLNWDGCSGSASAEAASLQNLFGPYRTGIGNEISLVRPGFRAGGGTAGAWWSSTEHADNC